MTKNQFIQTMKEQNITCSYSGNINTMFLSGDSNNVKANIMRFKNEVNFKLELNK